MFKSRDNRQIVVGHSYYSWLPQTMTWLYNQVTHLPPSIRNHIICEEIENPEQFSVPNIHCLREDAIWAGRIDRLIRKAGVRNHLQFLTKTAQEINLDILHSHFGNTAWANIDAVRHIGSKHIATFYGSDINFLPRQDKRWAVRYRNMFSSIDRVLCEGTYMAGSIEELGCPREKILVHHLGVAIETIPYHPRRWTAGEPLRILMAGSFREKKGFPHGLQALARLREHLPIEVTVIGDAGQDERGQAEKQKILEIVAHCGLGDCVRFLGYQPHRVLFEEAASHHIFLSPSVTASDGDTEGGAPVTIIEMAASGMAIVSSRHCDIPEVILDGETGLLADERRVDELSAHLLHLAEHPEKWHRYLDAGRAHIEAEYDAKAQGIRLSEIYSSLLAK